MPENPREEILVNPEFSILEFGDGYLALLQGGVIEQDEDGSRVAKLVIKPHNLLRKRYNIKDSDLDVNGNINFSAYVEDLIYLNIFDDANKKVLYTKTFNHEETELSNLSWNLSQTISNLRKQIITLEGENIYLSERLHMARSNPTEFLMESMDVFEKFQEKTNMNQNKYNTEQQHNYG